MSGEQIFEQARLENRQYITEFESKEILREVGIPVVETRITHSKEEAVSISKNLGFPVALKIVSPDVIHKSDIGGVKLDINDEAQVSEAYQAIISSVKHGYPSANIQGICVQKMAGPGIETIIGMTKDAQFGHVLMFGLGGILVEVLKDISLRVIPVTREDAAEMIKEIKGYSLLKGYRGQAPADTSSLERIIVKISELTEKYPQMKELDLNPVFVYNNGAVVADARIMLEPIGAT